MGRKKNAPVVIVRKDKRLHKGLHLLAFALTGGTSGIVTSAKAGTNAGYNARTRKLAEQGEADALREVAGAGDQEAARLGEEYPAEVERWQHSAEIERLARAYPENLGEQSGRPDLAAEQPGYDPDFDPAANFRRDHVPSSREYREAHGG
jgi:hypothetical protein